LGETKAGLFDLPALFDEVSAGLKVKLAEDFEALGITLKAMFIQSISPTEETAKAIDERASMGAIGDMQKYMQFKAARAMGDAAVSGGEGGGLAGAGVGLGAGMGVGAGMAGMISQAMQGAWQQPQQQPAAPAGAAAAAPAVMTLAEAATYLRVSPADVQTLITSGQVKAKQIGSDYRISKKALDDFLTS
jgi:excisionase family DNA binding protein